MSEPGKFVVQIVGDSTKFQSELTRAAAAAEREARRIEQSITRVGDRVKDFGKDLFKGALGAFGITLGAEGVIRAIEAMGEKAVEESASFNQLNAVILANGKSAGFTAKELEEANKKLQETSVLDDDVIRRAQAALLRFRSIRGETFKEALNLVPDLAAALGTTAPDAATALGRALTDPATGMRALRAAGIDLSEQQKDLAARLLETGDRAGSQKVILDELRRSVGGAGAAETEGLSGAVKVLKRAFDDLEKSAGRKLFADNKDELKLAKEGFEALTHAIEGSNI